MSKGERRNDHRRSYAERRSTTERRVDHEEALILKDKRVERAGADRRGDDRRVNISRRDGF